MTFVMNCIVHEPWSVASGWEVVNTYNTECYTASH